MVEILLTLNFQTVEIFLYSWKAGFEIGNFLSISNRDRKEDENLLEPEPVPPEPQVYRPVKVPPTPVKVPPPPVVPPVVPVVPAPVVPPPEPEPT